LNRFRATGWQVLTLKYGKKLMHLFSFPGGRTIRKWLIDCDNDSYNALVFRGGKAFRDEMMKSIGQEPFVAETLARYDDATLLDVMSNLGGHCFEV
jgi:pyruvate dehydrogenase E1 component